MLTFPKIVSRSLLISIGVLVGDGLVSFGMSSFGFSFIATMGDLMLGEVALLFLAAGLLVFSSSVGAIQFRKAILGSKQEYSHAIHKQAERKALALVLAGSFLFVILVAVAVLSMS